MVRTVKRVCVRTEGVYSSLNNFLPAGTITSTLPDSPHSFTEHGALAEDGWHVFPQAVSGFRDETALDKISFLARNRFISATYHVDPAHLQLFVRIYIIPWDLAGSRGELRLRCAKTVLEPGTKHLKQLLLRVRQDRSLWEGSVASSSNPQFLMNQAAVRSSID